MDKTPLPTAQFTEWLQAERPFHFSRWGDGEWIATLGIGDGKVNADQTEYSERLGMALNFTLQRCSQSHRPDYHPGLLSIAMTHLKPEIEAHVDKWNLKNIEWFNGDTVLNDSLNGRSWPLFMEIRKKKTVYVGPAFLKETVQDMLHVNHFLEIPEKNAINDETRILKELSLFAGIWNYDLILYSAGMASNWFIESIYDSHRFAVSQMDMGSMFDGYAGKFSRSYHRKLDWEKLRKVNCGE